MRPKNYLNKNIIPDCFDLILPKLLGYFDTKYIKDLTVAASYLPPPPPPQ
jgi:hypothetical protein